MGKLFYSSSEHGVKIPINFTPYGESEISTGRWEPVYKFKFAGEDVEVYKTDGLFGECLHFAVNREKIVDELDARLISEELPVEAVKPDIAFFNSGYHGKMTIDLRERKRKRLHSLPVFENDKYLVMQHALSFKFNIYEKIPEGMDDRNPVKISKKLVRHVSNVVEAFDILNEVHKEKNFNPYMKGPRTDQDTDYQI